MSGRWWHCEPCAVAWEGERRSPLCRHDGAPGPLPLGGWMGATPRLAEYAAQVNATCSKAAAFAASAGVDPWLWEGDR